MILNFFLFSVFIILVIIVLVFYGLFFYLMYMIERIVQNIGYNLVCFFIKYKKGGGMEMKEIDFVIDMEEIVEFFYKEFVRWGYILSEDELFEIVDIIFDYLIEKCMIDEELDEDD